ncbi:type II toxin-antitoxin system RelE/ParE family toxin [Laspinema olomoucense]|uniref:type II toxin-antitoxin system RelE/ParE family toxin n=1 Tax=Laspinema olomoucense TaxID=3231600 RepID=UPI0021BAF3F2|nr:type II toxin-antitoxin system RelE/ParE family toxin [Laspinema sp. D3d]MCT7971225.1 type II toxin-antitoxin system RelE/ParE family toxin [Laspinema sp. D3d]
MVTKAKKQHQNTTDKKFAATVNTDVQNPNRCSVEHTDTFAAWWETLSEADQIKVAAMVTVLKEKGVTLCYPHCSKINGCKKYSHIRELRVQSAQGHPYRILYAFDPNRTAILLTGGNKTGNNRWYETHIRIAEKEYETHLSKLRKGGRT